MEEKNDILKHISETHRREFHDRRQYEWKIVVGAISFYVLVAAGKLSDRLSLPEGLIFKLVAFLAILVLTVASCCYLYHLHKANRLNKQFAEEAEALLIKSAQQESLNAVLESAKGRAEHPGRSDWSLRWQVIIIVIFALAAAVLIA